MGLIGIYPHFSGFRGPIRFHVGVEATKPSKITINGKFPIYGIYRVVVALRPLVELIPLSAHWDQANSSRKLLQFFLTNVLPVEAERQLLHSEAKRSRYTSS